MDLNELGIRHLRTGLSWADYHRPGGDRWYRWMLDTLHEAGLEILLSIWHTPPSIAEGGSCSGPPRRLRDYADFIDRVIGRFGHTFQTLELWNEPNNRIKWNFKEFDPDWRKFGRMIHDAAYWARHQGVQTVLGGMIPVDHHWLGLMQQYGVLDYIDVVAIHAFPGMWEGDHYWWDWPDHWQGWDEKIAYIRAHAGDKPIWVTETGFANWCTQSDRPAGFQEQAERLRQAVAAPAERTYWYCLHDLDARFPCIEMTEDGGRIDPREYHLGLTTAQGRRKQSFATLARLLRGEVEQ